MAVVLRTDPRRLASFVLLRTDPRRLASFALLLTDPRRLASFVLLLTGPVLAGPRALASLVLFLSDARRFGSSLFLLLFFPSTALLLTELRRFVSALVLTDPLRFGSPEERRRVDESVFPFPPEAVLVDLRRLSLLPRPPLERLKLVASPSLSRRVDRRSLPMSLSLLARFSALPRVVELRKLPSLTLRRIR